MSLVVALGLALGTLALGDLALRALWPDARGFERFGLAAAAGLAVSLFVLYLPLAATGRAHFLPLAVLQVAAALAALPRVARAARATGGAGWVAVGCLVLLFAGVLRLAVLTPFGAYDDRAIYGLKGKALWLEGDVEGPLFTDLEVVHYHRDYELGLPLLIAHAAWATDPSPQDPQGREPAASEGEWVERYDAVTTWSPWAVLWPAALAALAAAMVLRARDLGRLRPLLLPLALPLAVVYPWIPGDAWSLGGADLPLTLLVGAAAWGAVAWWQERAPRGLLLAGALMAAAFLLKKDVALAWASGGAAALLARAPRPGRAAVVGTLALLALALVAVRQAGAGIPTPTFEEDYVRAVREGSLGVWLARVPLIVESFWGALGDAHMRLWWLLVLLAAVPAGLRAGGWRRFLALWVLLQLAALLAVFAVTPDQAAWHVRTASTRLLCHLVVPAGLLLVDLGVHLSARLRRELADGPTWSSAPR